VKPARDQIGLRFSSNHACACYNGVTSGLVNYLNRTAPATRCVSKACGSVEFRLLDKFMIDASVPRG